MKQQKTPEVLNDFFTLKNDISKRIEELENFCDDNFGNPRILCLEKGIIPLKKLLFYNPDINNELEESDLDQFRGLTIDMNKMNSGGANIADITKEIKPASPTKPKAKVNKLNKTNKFTSAKKNVNNLDNFRTSNKKGGKMSGEKTAYGNSDNVNNNIVSPQKDKVETVVKKKINVRLTEEEFKLYQKLRAKRMLTVK